MRFLLALLLLALPCAAPAQPFTPAEAERAGALVATALARSGVPSASVAVVRDGKIAFVHAYGRQSPALPVADPNARYPIASISKQFTAAALLLLEDDGKLSLDDTVSRYLSDIAGGDRITLRQLLNHSSGLRDYWPQDYSFAAMARPVTPAEIAGRWAKAPLDFEPGSDHQYSNTGYVVAGMIAEKVAGEPLLSFLTRRIFRPLGMAPVDADLAHGNGFPLPYARHALGPVRVETPAAPGWLFAAGGLAMTARDLARWNIARLDRTLLPADDWAAQESSTSLSDGREARYGLGVALGQRMGHRTVEHGGEAVGFLGTNIVVPDARVAVTVLVNGWFGAAQQEIAEGLLRLALPAGTSAEADDERAGAARAMLAALASGTLDATLLTGNARYYFTPAVQRDYRESLAPLGQPQSVVLARPPVKRGGFVQRVFAATYPGGRTLMIGTYAEPGDDGRWEQFLVTPGS